jgi:GT2 family glycosyltransferase
MVSPPQGQSTAPAAPPLVTAVLVNLNCAALVDLIFPSLAQQTYPNLEVLVVDNGSTDASCLTIERQYDARVIRLGTNAGFSGALNEGIREARGEYILSLNFDVVLEPGFVAALVDVLERRPDAGWAAGFMRRLRWEGVVEAIDCNGHYWLPSRYCYGYDPAHPELDYYDSEREVFGASACAALYRRTMLDDLAIDGEIFDRHLFAYFEDVDLDWRAQQFGYRCMFTPLARGAHMRGGTGLSRNPEVTAMLLSNRLLVMVKNDRWRDVLRDISPIVRRTARDVAVQLKREPRALWIALRRLARLLPAMMAKRRIIKRRRVAPPMRVRSLQVKTAFLG